MPAEQTHALALGDQHATVAGRGGRVASYRVAGRDVLTGAENPAKLAFRTALLAPWPNRVVGGTWTWRGRSLQLAVNDPATGAALHGLVYDVDWAVQETDGTSISLGYDLPASDGYPFPLRLTVRYALGPDGLACALTATNAGQERAPVGLGVHPYVAAPSLADGLEVTVPAGTVLETDARWQETGRVPVEAVGLDFRSARRIGDLELDTAFTDVQHAPDGRTEATVRLPDGATVVVWSGPTCRWWVLFTADTLAPEDRRRSLAVEPMTCPPNALNTGEVDVLAPGESLRLEWGFTLRGSVR